MSTPIICDYCGKSYLKHLIHECNTNDLKNTITLLKDCVKKGTNQLNQSTAIMADLTREASILLKQINTIIESNQSNQSNQSNKPSEPKWDHALTEKTENEMLDCLGIACCTLDKIIKWNDKDDSKYGSIKTFAEVALENIYMGGGNITRIKSKM